MTPSTSTRPIARFLLLLLFSVGVGTLFDATVTTQGPPPTAPGGGAGPGAGPGGGREGGVGRGRGRGMDPVATARLAALRAPLERLTPVTHDMLRNPPPGDWLHWRRTYNGWAHSPLDQITRDNVKDLRVAWTWGMESAGVSEFTPLVHDGILFLWNYGERIQALDAANGNLLWQYVHPMPPDFARENFYRTKRALAIAGNTLIVPTTNMQIVALAVKTGEPVWTVATDDFAVNRRVYNGGPLVVRDTIIMGASGCAPGTVGCFVTGHDAATGRERWRFNTTAQPDEPGGDTWNNLPAELRWGASVWTPPTYDPDLDLVFVGTGSPFPWSSVQRGTYQPEGGGTSGDGLYFNSTLALDPETGKLVWHYQHLPNDTFDQDYAFERIVLDIEWEGRPRKVVMTSGKPGVFEVLDAATGRFLFAKDPGMQNIFTFDPVTGVKTLLPPGPPEGIRRCPTNDGVRNFLAGSYSPLTNRYYISLNDICTGRAGETPDRLVALDMATREFAFDIPSRVMQSSAKLTTAGGLLFSGAADRYFRAFDDRDGSILWETRLQDIPNAFPITYAVDGKQYVATVAGSPGIIGSGAGRASAEYLRPVPTSVLWVWALP